MIQIKTIKRSSFNKYNESLKKFEANIEYPYGSDFFKIDHGESYFNFFERMGEPYFNIALYKNQIIACSCGIIRSVPYKGKMKKTWYVCDLKVHPEFRGRGLSTRLFKKNLLFNYLKCPRAYTISMNPNKGKNKVIKIIENFPFFPLKYEATLYFFEFSKNEICSFKSEIENIIGKSIKFISLYGIKDIILKSSHTAMPLFHAQYGSLADPISTSEKEEGLYMFCALENSALYNFLNMKVKPSATASLLSYNMTGFDWSFILSSDI